MKKLVIQTFIGIDMYVNVCRGCLFSPKNLHWDYMTSLFQFICYLVPGLGQLV